MNEKTKNKLIIERAKIAFKCSTQKQLAEILHVSPEDLSNRKRRGTFTELIEIEAYNRNINYDWILTGNGSMFLSEAVSSQRVADDLESREGVSTTKEVDNTILFSCTEKSLSLHQQLEHICRDGSEKQINAVAAILEGTEQSIMQFEAIMAEMLKLSKKIDQLETTLKSERRIPGAASQDNQTRRNAK